VVLAVGVVRLAQGEAAWNAWLASLGSPGAILFHLVLLAAFIYHAYSWFDIMPKTMPILFIRGRRVAATTITRLGWAVALIAALMLLALAWWWQS
jgi:fumarate reductase subunit C